MEHFSIPNTFAANGNVLSRKYEGRVEASIREVPLPLSLFGTYCKRRTCNRVTDVSLMVIQESVYSLPRTDGNIYCPPLHQCGDFFWFPSS